MKKLSAFFVMCQLVLLKCSLFAEDGETPAPPRDQGFGQTLIMIAIALLFFYLILWRPEQKRRKEMDTQRSSMKKGDRVTAMGIVGTVDRIKEQTVILKMVDGSKIEVLKAAISDVSSGGGEEEKKSEIQERNE